MAFYMSNLLRYSPNVLLHSLKSFSRHGQGYAGASQVVQTYVPVPLLQVSCRQYKTFDDRGNMNSKIRDNKMKEKKEIDKSNPHKDWKKRAKAGKRYETGDGLASFQKTVSDFIKQVQVYMKEMEAKEKQAEITVEQLRKRVKQTAELEASKQVESLNAEIDMARKKKPKPDDEIKPFKLRSNTKIKNKVLDIRPIIVEDTDMETVLTHKVVQNSNKPKTQEHTVGTAQTVWVNPSMQTSEPKPIKEQNQHEIVNTMKEPGDTKNHDRIQKKISSQTPKQSNSAQDMYSAWKTYDKNVHNSKTPSKPRNEDQTFILMNKTGNPQYGPKSGFGTSFQMLNEKDAPKYGPVTQIPKSSNIWKLKSKDALPKGNETKHGFNKSSYQMWLQNQYLNKSKDDDAKLSQQSDRKSSKKSNVSESVIKMPTTNQKKTKKSESNTKLQSSKRYEIMNAIYKQSRSNPKSPRVKKEDAEKIAAFNNKITDNMKLKELSKKREIRKSGSDTFILATESIYGRPDPQSFGVNRREPMMFGKPHPRKSVSTTNTKISTQEKAANQSKEPENLQTLTKNLIDRNDIENVKKTLKNNEQINNYNMLRQNGNTVNYNQNMNDTKRIQISSRNTANKNKTRTQTADKKETEAFKNMMRAIENRSKKNNNENKQVLKREATNSAQNKQENNKSMNSNATLKTETCMQSENTLVNNYLSMQNPQSYTQESSATNQRSAISPRQTPAPYRENSQIISRERFKHILSKPARHEKERYFDEPLLTINSNELKKSCAKYNPPCSTTTDMWAERLISKMKKIDSENSTQSRNSRNLSMRPSRNTSPKLSTQVSRRPLKTNSLSRMKTSVVDKLVPNITPSVGFQSYQNHLSNETKENRPSFTNFTQRDEKSLSAPAKCKGLANDPMNYCAEQISASNKLGVYAFGVCPEKKMVYSDAKLKKELKDQWSDIFKTKYLKLQQQRLQKYLATKDLKFKNEIEKRASEKLKLTVDTKVLPTKDSRTKNPNLNDNESSNTKINKVSCKESPKIKTSLYKSVTSTLPNFESRPSNTKLYKEWSPISLDPRKIGAPAFLEKTKKFESKFSTAAEKVRPQNEIGDYKLSSENLWKSLRKSENEIPVESALKKYQSKKSDSKEALTKSFSQKKVTDKYLNEEQRTEDIDQYEDWMRQRDENIFKSLRKEVDFLKKELSTLKKPNVFRKRSFQTSPNSKMVNTRNIPGPTVTSKQQKCAEEETTRIPYTEMKFESKYEPSINFENAIARTNALHKRLNNTEDILSELKNNVLKVDSSKNKKIKSESSDENNSRIKDTSVKVKGLKDRYNLPNHLDGFASMSLIEEIDVPLNIDNKKKVGAKKKNEKAKKNKNKEDKYLNYKPGPYERSRLAEIRVRKEREERRRKLKQIAKKLESYEKRFPHPEP